MQIKRITGEDVAVINQWFEKWGMSYEPKELPEIGYIVPGVAAGFLYRTDSKIAFLDGYVANPDRNIKEQRDEALDLITELLLLDAVKSGCTKIIALSSNKSIQDRAVKWGFYNRGDFTMLVKGLE